MEFHTIDSCSQKQNNNFTVLRLIAALLVIYGHSYPISGSGHPDLILQVIKSKFAGGVAVDVFFLISGFLICASWGRNSFFSFSLARILRIYPALIVCVCLCVFVVGPLLTTADGYFLNPETWRYLYHNASSWQTEYFLPGVFLNNPDKAINGSLWSLPLEVRLYCLIAIVGVLACLKEGRYFVVCVLAGLAYFFTPKDSAFMVQYVSWAGSAAFFMSGAFFWLYRKSIILSAPLLAFLIVLAVALNGTQQFTYIYFVLVSYATFYLAYIPNIGFNPKKDLSYGVYLYGWPVQQLVIHFVPDCSAEFNAITSMLIVLVIAYFSWVYIESPALALHKKSRR